MVDNYNIFNSLNDERILEIIRTNTIGRNQLTLDFYLKFWNFKDNCREELVDNSSTNKNQVKRIYKNIDKQIVYEKGYFFDVYNKFKKNNADLMYAREAISAKKYFGRFHPFFNLGTTLREGVISSVKNNDSNEIIWLRDSIALISENNLKEAVKSNINRSEYYPERIEEYLSGLKKDIDYIIIDDFNPILKSKMLKDDRLKWLFRDKLYTLKNLLTNATDVEEIRISKMPKIGSRLLKNERYATQMYLGKFPGPNSNYMLIGGVSGEYDRYGQYFGVISNKDNGHQ